MELNGVYVRIPDYRPYSGPFCPGQPQHDCRTWPGLLQYRSGGRRVPLVTERTTFESTTPCLARFTMTFRTADDAATVSMTTTEFPQNDEMRTFLHLRYDWDKAVTIDGDARSTFRWLNLNDKRLPAKLVWLDAEGVPQVVDVAEDSDPLPLTALAAEAPYVGSHDLGGYHSFCLVRSYSARLGGQEQTQVHVSAHFGKRTGDTWFTVDQEDLTLQPGDYLEADLMLMPHADPTEPGAIPQRERQRYGTHPPRITEVKRGEKLADFPPRVRAEADAAVFTVEGGQKTMPLIVEGLSASKVPMLWEGSTWMDQQVKGGDGYQVNVGPDGSYRAIFAAPMRDEQTRTWSVTLATCSSDISRLSDDNGFPALEAVEPGRFALSTPVLFAPGTNTLREGSSLGSFEGEGIRVRAVPISARLQGATGKVTITRWDESAADVAVDGLAALTFHDIGRRTTWAVTVDGTTETRRADTGALELPLSEGNHTIALRRAPELEGKR